MNATSLSPIDNVELDLLHQQAQSNYELMVSYKKSTYDLRLESEQLKK